MKLSDWESEYNHIIRFILRRMEPDTLKFYNDKKEELVRTLELFNLFDNDLFKKHYKSNRKRFTIRYKEFEYLCKRYIKKSKKEDNHFAGWVFFDVLTDMKPYFKVEYSKYNLYDTSNFQREATQQEKEYAEKTFPHDQFSFLDDTTKIVEYKGLKLYVYSRWDVGYMIDWKGEVRKFDLIWDWWYPIDMYLYLEKNWKYGKPESDKNILF